MQRNRKNERAPIPRSHFIINKLVVPAHREREFKRAVGDLRISVISAVRERSQGTAFTLVVRDAEALWKLIGRHLGMLAPDAEVGRFLAHHVCQITPQRHSN